MKIHCQMSDSDYVEVRKSGDTIDISLGTAEEDCGFILLSPKDAVKLAGKLIELAENIQFGEH